jgi:hypothetical protein
MNSSYVYLLVDPRNKLPFYVGKGMGERCHFHVQEARYYVKRKSLKLNKIRKILSLGMAPEIVKVEENVSDRQAIELECLLIAEMRDLGIPLTNMTDGGDGAKGYKHTEEHKQMMRERFVGRVFTDEHLQRMRKPKSVEGRAAIAAARITTNYRPSEETKRKTSQALLGRPSPMMGRVHSEDARAKMSAAGKGKPKPKVECPNCKKAVAVNTAKRWHFDNCKESVCH